MAKVVSESMEKIRAGEELSFTEKATLGGSLALGQLATEFPVATNTFASAVNALVTKLGGGLEVSIKDNTKAVMKILEPGATE